MRFVAAGRRVGLLLVEHLAARGHDPLERLLEAVGLVDELELQQRGLADELARAGLVADPGELDEDAVGPLLEDRGLGDAELVDAVADGLETLVDRVGADPVGLGGAHLHADLAGGVLLDLEGRVLGDLLADLVERGVRRRHEDHRRQPFAPHRADREALAPQRVAQLVRHALGGVLHRLVHLDAEDEVHAALEVEPEAQLLHRHQLVPPGRHLPRQRRHEADRPGDQRDTMTQNLTLNAFGIPPS